MALQLFDFRDISEIIPHLEQNKLHTSDLSDKIRFYKWSEGITNGYAGVELLGEVALLRSVVIAKENQKKGAGKKMVSAVLDELKKLGIKEVYLLTLSAEGFFSKLGFKTISKDQVPKVMMETEEFRTICPSSAICMVKELK